MHLHVLVYTHIFSCSVSLEDQEAMTTQEQHIHLDPRSWLLMPFSNKRNQGSFKKIADSRMVEEIYKMSFDHTVVTESKEVLKSKQKGLPWWRSG